MIFGRFAGSSASKTSFFRALAALSIAAVAGVASAEARCSKRAADPLITARYSECSKKEMLSYLYNDLVTPYSFQCAKRISASCKTEKCSAPANAEDEKRCRELYVSVLNECEDELEGAARMARCKDTGSWPGGLDVASNRAKKKDSGLRSTQSSRTAHPR